MINSTIIEEKEGKQRTSYTTTVFYIFLYKREINAENSSAFINIIRKSMGSLAVTNDAYHNGLFSPKT